MILRPVIRQPIRPVLREIGAGVGGLVTSNDVDLFIVCGQSNSLGIGTAAESPLAPHGMYISGTNITAPLSDPMGNVNTGSSWPSFSNEWARRTGRKSAFVYRGVVASSLIASGTGWNPTGTLRSLAVTAAGQAISALNSSTYDLGRVYFLWLQGEQEASTYDGSAVSDTTYAAALSDLADYFKTEVPSMESMGVIHILGTGSGSAITAQSVLHRSYERIRSAQTAAVEANDNLVMLYDGSHHVLSRGGMSDGTHYKQSTYNLIGRMAARELASPRNTPMTGLASPVATTTYADSTYGTKSSRTVAHTNHASTRCLILAVTATIPGANVASALTATFDGKTMRFAARTSIGSSSPAGNTTAGIFYIDEGLYGGSLGGASGSIVVGTTNSQIAVSMYAIEMSDPVGYVDTEGGDFPAAASPGDTGLSVTLPRTYYQTIVVGVGSAIASSASALTWTSTGFGTKAMDHGLGNGTLVAQTAVGYGVENSLVTEKTYGVTFSGNCTHRAFVLAAFRKALDGE